MMKLEEYSAVKLVSNCYVSPFAWTEYSLNPYQGCWHDCKYCDGKSERYHVHDDFSTTIKIKNNAAELLKRFLTNKGHFISKNMTLFNESDRKKASFIIFIASGVCDPYQPSEARAKTTQQLLQVAYDYGIPIHLLTKNTLVLRDLDLLKKINQETYAGVHFTVTLADDSTQRIFEPNASPTSKRFEAINTLRNESIPSGIYFSPVLPFIGDTDKNMNAIFKKAKEVNAQFVYTLGLTLKPGRNKNEYFNTIQEHFPELLPKYELLYGNNHEYGTWDSKQSKTLGLIRSELKAYKYSYEYGIPYSVPRYIPEGRIKSNLTISEVLQKVAYLKSTIFNSYYDAKPFSYAAYHLESFKKDIFSLSKEEMNALPMSSKVHPFLIDYFINGESTMLKLLEEEAYRKITAK